jgi:spermidine synthase
MNVAEDGWFTELGSMWPGQGLSLKVKEVLYKGKSKFQVRCMNLLAYIRSNLMFEG